MRKGFTLVEVLLGLIFIPMILALSLSVLRIMTFVQQERITQVDVFLLQQRQYLIHANDVSFDGDTIVGTYLNEHFVLYFDRNRWVKRPGYEILLEHVERVYREKDCMVLVLNVRSICIELP